MWLKTVIGTTAAALSVGLALGYLLKAGQRQVSKAATAQSTRAACALSPDERDGRRQMLASLWARARDTQKRDTGYAFEFAFDAETLNQATNVISLESRCCSFLEFRLTARPSADYLLLEITGPEGTEGLMAGSISLAASLRKTGETSPKKSSQAGCCPGDGPCAPESGAAEGSAK